MPQYAGTGKAALLHTNQQIYLVGDPKNFENLTANYQSIGVQLERICREFYPWGAAIQVQFQSAPGTFEIDLQGSETDELNSYNNMGSSLINAVNTGNFGRYDMPNTVFPKFVSIFVKTLTGSVGAKVILTR